VDWTVTHGSNALDETNTRFRLGVAHCTEFLIDVPNYFLAINGSQPTGFGQVRWVLEKPERDFLAAALTAGA